MLTHKKGIKVVKILPVVTIAQYHYSVQSLSLYTSF